MIFIIFSEEFQYQYQIYAKYWRGSHSMAGNGTSLVERDLSK